MNLFCVYMPRVCLLKAVKMGGGRCKRGEAVIVLLENKVELIQYHFMTILLSFPVRYSKAGFVLENSTNIALLHESNNLLPFQFFWKWLTNMSMLTTIIGAYQSFNCCKQNRLQVKKA